MTEIVTFPEREEEIPSTSEVMHCPECDNTFLHLWENGDISCGYCGEVILNISK